jgi:2',3'-cyclic-nucleotide 2'-phosphodiesterase (5'-nucleotidase family)
MRSHRTVIAIIALILPLLVAVPGAAQADDAHNFLAPLSGAQEVPAVSTDGRGVAALHLNTSETRLDYALITVGLEATTQAHIHIGAAGENGPIVAFLFGFVDGGVTRDGLLARGTVTGDDLIVPEGSDFDGTMADLVARLRNGTAYVNVHTVANPGGEIRGQVEALPPTTGARFVDDDGDVHETNIEVIAAAEITRGCNPPDNDEFCPDDPITRGQMAAFLNRALNLGASDEDFFTDDDASIFEADINAIAAVGITKGCNPPDNDEFCPNDPVTRAQMASFLVRALRLSAGGDADLFVDDDQSVHEADIDRLGVAAITRGCNPPDNDEFCPNDPVTRAQMATFLARTFGWEVPRPAVTFWLTVLHNNDGESDLLIEGDFAGVARFATLVGNLKQQAEADTDGVVMLSSGDNFLAGPQFQASLDKGVPFYDSIALSLIGYDAVAIGNHEFDFGPDVLRDFIVGFASPPFLSANLDFSGEPNLQNLVNQGRIAGSATITAGSTTIGVVGATTPNLDFISSPRNVEVIDDVAGEVQAEIDALKAAGVDKVILISHLQSVSEDLALAPQLSGVDVMIAGGGDELLAGSADALIPGDEEEVFGPYPLRAVNRDGREVPIITTSGSYGYVGRLVAGFDPGGQVVGVDQPTSGPVRVSGVAPDAVAPDPDVEEQVTDPVAEAVAALAANVIGTSEVVLDGTREAVRTEETNEGNLIADALLSKATQLAGEFGAPAPDVALQNGGGIRNDSEIPAGDVTELDTFDMVPFPNFVTIVPDIPREQFKEILENAVSNVENVDGRFAQVAGFSFTWDPAGTPQELDDEGNVVTEGTRIQEVTLDDATVIVTGGAVVDGPALNIATIDFLARGGDQYPYRGADFTSVGVTYQQALADFIVDVLGGTITAADYPEGGEGRIIEVP